MTIASWLSRDRKHHMQKICCPICGRFFIWTDDQPLQGPCPQLDCEWQYDIHEEIRKGLAERTTSKSRYDLYCPKCGQGLESAWTCCETCGALILASRTFNKKQFIMFIVVLILICLSVSYHYWF
jgi:predicted nucleic acid-binding Zn ribbon protein